jgi:hypothetical protein
MEAAGVVYSISAIREEGKSLRSTRERRMWCRVSGWSFEVGVEVEASGERDMFHASPRRKRRDDVGSWNAGLDGWCDEGREAEMRSSVPRMDGRFLSSHCVSILPAKKSSLETIPRRMARFVLTPSMRVSLSTRRAFRTADSQLEAVTMIFARRLSKSSYGYWRREVRVDADAVARGHEEVGEFADVQREVGAGIFDAETGWIVLRASTQTQTPSGFAGEIHDPCPVAEDLHLDVVEAVHGGLFDEDGLRGDSLRALATRFGSSDAWSRWISRIPRPPPPSTALIMTGYPTFSTNARISSKDCVE